MQENVKQMFKPSRALIKQHLEFVVSGMKMYCEGRLEISYGDAKNKPTLSENFSIDEVDKAADFAVQQNALGKNVYVTGALLQDDCESMLEHKRSSDSDFYACNSIWCDIDNKGAPITAEELRRKYAHFPPSLVVVTGRQHEGKPHLRVHLWWKLDEPLTNGQEVRTLVRGIQQTLGGDPATTNECRIMRLGGTVAWPVEGKEGRITEQTELMIPKNHQKSVNSSALIRNYPEVVDNTIKTDSNQPQESKYHSTVAGLQPETVDDGRDMYMSDMVYASISNLAAENGAWPTAQEVYDDVWPVYSRKVSPRDPRRTLDDEGRGSKTLQQKIKSKLRLFVSGRMRGVTLDSLVNAYKSKAKDSGQKAGQAESGAQSQQSENKQENAEAQPDKKPDITPTFLEDIDIDSIPPREFLYHNMVARKYVTMIVAAPGAGKSILTLGVAISAATGKPWGEWSTPKNQPIRVWMYNNEEGFDELRRRVKGVMIDRGIKKEDFGGRFALDSGEQKAITIAKLDDKGSVIYTPDFTQLKAAVLDRKIDLLIIDPFAETYDVNENSNDQIKNVTRLYRDIATECNCGVILVHHARKGMGSEGAAGNADMARGGGAQIGVVRRAFTLATMDETEAKALGVPTEDRRWFVRLDDAKSNITAPANKITWLKLKSIHINNGSGLFIEGDSVGVLNHISADEIMTEFEDQNQAEYEKIMNHLVQWMQFHNMSEAKMVNAVSELMRYPDKFSYKKRKIYDMIPAAIVAFRNKGGILLEDEVNYLSISEDKGAKNSLIIERKVKS